MLIFFFSHNRASLRCTCQQQLPNFVLLTAIRIGNALAPRNQPLLLHSFSPTTDRSSCRQTSFASLVPSRTFFFLGDNCVPPPATSILPLWQSTLTQRQPHDACEKHAIGNCARAPQRQSWRVASSSTQALANDEEKEERRERKKKTHSHAAYRHIKSKKKQTNRKHEQTTWNDMPTVTLEPRVPPYAHSKKNGAPRTPRRHGGSGGGKKRERIPNITKTPFCPPRRQLKGFFFLLVCLCAFVFPALVTTPFLPTRPAS